MIMAFPVTIIGMIITGIAALLVLKQHRKRRKFLLGGAVINWMAVVFFVAGASALIDLVEFIEPEWVTWNVAGLLIPIISGVFLFIAFILDIKYSPKEEAEAGEDELKFDISAAMAEEEEEDEAFECPACGKEFTEMVSECPECGAEFEGLEEDEDEEEEDEDGEEEEEEDEE
jgi:hypothetical protein